MKQLLLITFLMAVSIVMQAQLEDDFSTDPEAKDWILAQGAQWKPGEGVVMTPAAGGNIPSMIGTPAVNKTFNTVKVCFDIVPVNNNGDMIPYSCNPTFMDVLFVKSSVTSSKDAEKPENIIGRVDNYVLMTGTVTQCLLFTFPPNVQDTAFKVFLSFHDNCGVGGYRIAIDNASIGGVIGTLPVEIIQLNANRNGMNVTVQWTTTFESNNTGFQVQRSNGNGAFETAGFVATRTADGNSNVPLQYQFKEMNTSDAITWYRLVQVDKDGASKVYNAIAVRGMAGSAKTLVYPNPGRSGNMNVLFGSNAIRHIVITDLSGKVIRSYNGFREDNLVINGLRAGNYMLLVTNQATKERQSLKIVIVQ